MSRTMTPALYLCSLLAGCTPLQQADPVVEHARIENTRVEQMLEQASARAPVENDACPPLPKLPENPTRFEGRLFTLTIIALYEQCAKSKQ